MAAKNTAKGATDAEKVQQHMNAVNHTLKKEMETLRKIITKSSGKLQERIKWNAPSYYYIDDIVTFGPLRNDRLLLVFHHPFIVKLPSPLLEGDYKDRRLAYFNDMKAIKENKKEIERIITAIIDMIDNK